MQPETDSSAKSNGAVINDPIGETIFAIGNALAKLEPGALAQLRRETGDPLAPRPPYFWRLLARHPEIGRNEETWLRVIRIMAILTDKGDPEGKRSPHRPKSKGTKWLGFGASLCDGGDPAWGAGELEPKGMLSELRFARLLAATDTMRADLLERAARALTAKKPAGGNGFDCADMAKFLLYQDNPKHGQRLARDYYARLDRDHQSDTRKHNADTGDDA
jgi:CRISPR system Cascade subunit CasB